MVSTLEKASHERFGTFHLFAKIAKANDIDTLEALPVPVVGDYPGGSLQDSGSNDYRIRGTQAVAGSQSSCIQEYFSTNRHQVQIGEMREQSLILVYDVLALQLQWPDEQFH